MLHEIEAAQNDIRTREDRILEIMMESDELNAGIKKSEAELKTAEKEIAAERAALDAEMAGAAGRNRQDDRRARRSSSPRSIASVLEHFRNDREGTERGRRRRSERRAVHDLPRAPSAAGVQRSPEERVDHPVRQLSPDSLFRRQHRSVGARLPGREWPSSRISMAAPAAIPGPPAMACASKTSTARSINEFNGFLGTSTNNVAEYNGLLAALKYAQQHGHRAVRIKSDSELLVKQMRGEYQVKNAGPAAALSAGAHDCARASTASCTSTCGASRTRTPTGSRTWPWTKARKPGIRDWGLAD